MHAAVIVLGDLGRSPRMQYHAHSLAVNDVRVDLIGEAGDPVPSFLSHPGIHVHRLRPSRGFSGVPRAAVTLFTALRAVPRPDLILVQTPPAIPTLVVAWMVARLRRSRLIVDWHNLGWTLIAAESRRGRLAAALARRLERACAPLADGHLAVSAALAGYLRASCGLPATVVRDRPPDVTPVRVGTDDQMRATLIARAGLPAGSRPAIVLSPTSWTRDETLDMLVSAADDLDARWTASGPRDGLLMVVSGHGAGRDAFEARINARRWSRVRIITTWVPGDDYPALVAAADAGISLHRSSSGLDLPMKICDFQAAGIPVCALDYGDTLLEMITPGQDAVLFRDAAALGAALDGLFRHWPAATPQLQALQAGAQVRAAGARWSDGWQTEARPLLLGQDAR